LATPRSARNGLWLPGALSAAGDSSDEKLNAKHYAGVLIGQKSVPLMVGNRGQFNCSLSHFLVILSMRLRRFTGISVAAVPYKNRLFSISGCPRTITVQNELNKLSYVEASDPINQLPMDLNSTSGDLSWRGKPTDLQTEIVATWTGYGFAKTLGIQMAEGRDFSRDYPGDSLSYVINESAAKMMGMQMARWANR
jgi:hypothetical protein